MVVDTSKFVYSKIQSLYKRDMENNGRIIVGKWSTPEFEYLRNLTWLFTEKVHGTNIRLFWNGKSITLAGRSAKSQVSPFLVDSIMSLIDTDLWGVAFPDVDPCSDYPVVVYGEGYGARVQGNGGRYIPDGQGFVVFDIRIGHWWLKRDDVVSLAYKLGLRAVPNIGQGTLADMDYKVREGIKSIWGDFMAEGIVAKPIVDLKTRSGERIIGKLKCSDYNYLFIEGVTRKNYNETIKPSKSVK